MENLQMFALMIVLFCCLGNSFASKEACFQAGECTDSYHLSSGFTTDKFACLEKCKSNSQCNWFTFFPESNICELLHNCSNLDAQRCPDCLTGQPGCVVDEPTCFVKGECRGKKLHIATTATEEDCLQECQTTFGCTWFTFHSVVKAPESFCILYQDCSSIDETCSTCVSGEGRCETGSKSGYVAFIVGGNTYRSQVELFSPNGNCQHELATIDVAQTEPFLAYIDEKIISCGGHSKRECYVYNIAEDSWSVFSTASYTHNYEPAATYNNKLYIADDTNPEVFDPVEKTWASWPTTPKELGEGPCMVAWHEDFLLIGGRKSDNGVQRYSHATQTWSIVESSSAPMIVDFSGCIVLPTDEILVVGAEDPDIAGISAALYNATANSWTKLAYTQWNHHGVSLVRLGQRVFALGSRDQNIVEEFHYNNNTRTTLDAGLIVHRTGHQDVLSLPAHLFHHLPGGCVGVK